MQICALIVTLTGKHTSQLVFVLASSCRAPARSECGDACRTAHGRYGVEPHRWLHSDRSTTAREPPVAVGRLPERWKRARREVKRSLREHAAHAPRIFPDQTCSLRTPDPPESHRTRRTTAEPSVRAPRLSRAARPNLDPPTSPRLSRSPNLCWRRLRGSRGALARALLLIRSLDSALPLARAAALGARGTPPSLAAAAAAATTATATAPLAAPAAEARTAAGSS